MNFDGYELQIFVSVLGILASAFVALLVDFLKGSNERLRESHAELMARHETLSRQASGDTKRILGALGEQTTALKKVIDRPIRIAVSGNSFFDESGMMGHYRPRAPFAPLVVHEIPAPRREAVEDVAADADKVKILAEEKVAPPFVEVPEVVAATPVFSEVVIAAPVVAAPTDLSEDDYGEERLEDIVIEDDSLPSQPFAFPQLAELRAQNLQAATEQADAFQAAAARSAPLDVVLPQLSQQHVSASIFAAPGSEALPIKSADSLNMLPVEQAGAELPSLPKAESEAIEQSEAAVSEEPTASPFDRFMEELAEDFDAHPERYEVPSSSESYPPTQEVSYLPTEAKTQAALGNPEAHYVQPEALPLSSNATTQDAVDLLFLEAAASAAAAEAAAEAASTQARLQGQQQSGPQRRPQEFEAVHEGVADGLTDDAVETNPNASGQDLLALGTAAGTAVSETSADSTFEVNFETNFEATDDEAAPNSYAVVEELVPSLDVPSGVHPAEVLNGLMERREALTGLVVSIGINEFSHIHENLGRNAADQLLSSVDQLMTVLIGREGFCTRSREDEFVLIFPKLAGPAAQRSLSELSEKLWDFQLRNLGTFSVVFSWGALEAVREPLREALNSAHERMKETQSNRRTASVGSGAGRRRRVG